MPESILDTTKKVLGIDSSYDVFDQDVLMHINSVFSTLNQLKVGPEYAYYVTSNAETWEDFLGDEKNINAVKSYMFLRVKLLFDPPATSFAQDSMQKQATELEWRLNVTVDPGGAYSPSVPGVPITPTDPIVIQGEKGDKGDKGDPGEPGPPGAPGGSSDVFKFRSKTNAQSGDPTTGRIQWSDLNQTASTRIDIDTLTEDNLDVTYGLATLVPGNKILIQEFNISANFQQWEIVSAVDNGGWFSFDVILLNSGGSGTSNFVGNLVLAVQVTRVGAQGEKGDKGDPGVPGDYVVTNPTTQKWATVDIRDDNSPTTGWLNRLEFLFRSFGTSVSNLVTWINEYGEIRAVSAKSNTVAVRVFVAANATELAARSNTVPVLEVTDQRDGTRTTLFGIFKGGRMQVGQIQQANANVGTVFTLDKTQNTSDIPAGMPIGTLIVKKTI